MFRLNRNERSHWSGNGVHVESELVFMIGRNMHLTALTAEFTVGEGELMTHDEPFFMAPDDKHDLISGTCSHLP